MWPTWGRSCRPCAGRASPHCSPETRTTPSPRVWPPRSRSFLLPFLAAGAAFARPAASLSPPAAACPTDGRRPPGRGLRRAKPGFWGAGQPLARCRGAPGPRGRVPKPQSTRLTRLKLERLFFALIFAKKPQATLKNSIPSANPIPLNGFDALNATYAPATSRNPAYCLAWQRWESHLSAQGCWPQFQAPRLSRR